MKNEIQHCPEKNDCPSLIKRVGKTQLEVRRLLSCSPTYEGNPLDFTLSAYISPGTLPNHTQKSMH